MALPKFNKETMKKGLYILAIWASAGMSMNFMILSYLAAMNVNHYYGFAAGSGALFLAAFLVYIGLLIKKRHWLDD